MLLAFRPCHTTQILLVTHGKEEIELAHWLTFLAKWNLLVLRTDAKSQIIQHVPK